MKPLLLLPGMLCDAEIWRDAAGGLDGDVRIVPVLRGATIATMADAVLRAAPPRFAIGGVSMGGYVALEVVRQAPRRVSGLLLANTSARADTTRQRAGRDAAIEEARAGRFDGVVERLLPLLVHPAWHRDGAVMRRLRAMLHRVGAPVFIEQQTATASRPDSRSLLAGIGVPAVIVGGDADRIVPPEHAIELAEMIPGARLELLASCGHLSPIERGRHVGALLAALIEG